MTQITVNYEQQTLPVLEQCDAVVVGASLGGIAVALELARAGQRVTLVEPRTYPAREITATLRPWLHVPASATLPAFLAEALEAAGKRTGDEQYALNLDTLKIQLEDQLLAAGVKLLYASLVVGVQTEHGALRGVVIGNKSGRQVIQCRLLVDTSETALVARVLGEAFEPMPAGSLPYRRVLEFDGVSPQFSLDQSLELAGIPLRFRPGYRDRQVLVECALDLEFAFENAFSISARETQARQQTIAVAAALTHDVPAFESAYLSGASYELAGRHAPPLRQAERAWAQPLANVSLHGGAALARLAGAAAGVWYLNEAAAQHEEDDFSDPLFTGTLGVALGTALAAHWNAAAAPITAANGAVPAAPTPDPAAPQLREPYSPQRGRPYPRVPFVPESLPVLREIDVLVVGGGSSGASAAITAAREGVRTVLLEMNPGLGGTGTFGGVHSYWFGRRIGFSAKVMQWVDDMHVYLHHPAPKGVIPKWNIEAKSHALLKAAQDAGAEILFNAYVIGTLLEADRVCGVVVATRMGIGIIRAHAVVDATGDGDVAAFAGADFIYGNERDHITMWYALAQFPRPGLTRNHFTSMVDVSNIEDYTRAILAGRRRGSKEAMHDHGIYVAPRESRHIHADIVLNLTEQLRQQRWDDVVNVAFSNHDVKGHSGSDWLRIGLIPPNLEIEIPYRALLPRRLENLIVVGKAISATHDALPAIRMQADLENLGGVAALAAAQAVRAGVPPRQIDIRQLQARLVEESVLPSEILHRTLRSKTYTDAELQAMIAALSAETPLLAYSDMELTDLYEGTIPLVEICCAGAQVIPLLEAAHAEAEGARKVLLAQMLALVSSTAGVETLVRAIEAHLQGDRLPARTAHIRYTQLPPDHGAMPEVVYLLYSLGMTPDERAIPVWKRIADLLAHTVEEDFYEEMKGVFYYVDAVAYGIERLGIRLPVPLLQRVHQYAPFHGKTAYAGFQPDYVQERLAYLELVIGRALARCGSADGFIILASYLNDNRALLAEHAHSELVAITGEDYGKDVQAWSRWIEFNGDDAPSVPWAQSTEPIQAWAQPVFTLGS